MDISLKPVFLYKIPNNCHEILISSNILYSIQYVEKDSKVGTVVPLGSNKVLSDDGIVTESETTTTTEDQITDDDKEKDIKSSAGELVNAVGVISSAMASVQQVQNGDRDVS